LSIVEDTVSTVVGRPISQRKNGDGLGVVVTMIRGRWPSRTPKLSMSHVGRSFVHAQISSHQAPSCCGPRRRSGSSAEKQRAVAPFGQVRRALLGS
jgi:hypothetical protein